METAFSILVVEDDELVRSFLARALSGVSEHVDACGSGAEALEAVDGTRYAAILLDGLLPDIHGVERGRRLIHLPQAAGAGICFVSGSLRRAAPMRSGISALPKPLRLRELTDAVTELLAWHTRHDASIADRVAALDTLAAELLVG